LLKLESGTSNQPVKGHKTPQYMIHLRKKPQLLPTNVFSLGYRSLVSTADSNELVNGILETDYGIVMSQIKKFATALLFRLRT
jgi:hypothetical protein